MSEIKTINLITINLILGRYKNPYSRGCVRVYVFTEEGTVCYFAIEQNQVIEHLKNYSICHGVIVKYKFGMIVKRIWSVFGGNGEYLLARIRSKNLKEIWKIDSKQTKYVLMKIPSLKPSGIFAPDGRLVEVSAPLFRRFSEERRERKLFSRRLFKKSTILETYRKMPSSYLKIFKKQKATNQKFAFINKQ